MDRSKPEGREGIERLDRPNLESFVRSDALPELLSLAGSIPGIAPLLKEVLRIGVVLDADIVQRELRWRLGRRRKPTARTKLHEVITSGVIVPFVPTFLDTEISEHLADIANATGVGIEDARKEWQTFRSLLHFYAPKLPCKLAKHQVVDPDDLPYIAAADELGLPIYSRDHHYRQMGAPVIAVLIDGTAQAYSRSSTLRIAVTMGSAFTVTISVGVIAAVCRIAKRLLGWFGDLPPGVQLAILVAVMIALANASSRAKLCWIWNWVKRNATPPVLRAITDIAAQFARAEQTEAEAFRCLQESLPSRRKRSALMHARTICLAARAPLSLFEIQRLMCADVYITRARDFQIYLRRVLVTSGDFQEISPGIWTLVVR